MELFDSLKQANVSVHVVATGAAAGLQQKLWEMPGSSAYLSGGTFPYAQEEQEELLGFMPQHFCSEENAVDLASAAYMKAYRFGGKAPVGVGITASVTSEKDHRGDHRVHVCVMTDTTVQVFHQTLEKTEVLSRGFARFVDGKVCDDAGLYTMLDALKLTDFNTKMEYKDGTELAKARFWSLPYFTADGKRHRKFVNINHALMPGAFNPPHEGHLCMADMYEQTQGGRVVFSMCANPPHKAEMTVQDCLKRAKMLRGRDRLFTRDDSYYVDKARAFPHTPMLIGADALQRMFDPKWGLNQEETLREFQMLGTRFYVSGREVDGKFVELADVLNSLPSKLATGWFNIAIPMEGRWDISSTQLRERL